MVEDRPFAHCCRGQAGCVSFGSALSFVLLVFRRVALQLVFKLTSNSWVISTNIEMSILVGPSFVRRVSQPASQHVYRSFGPPVGPTVASFRVVTAAKPWHTARRSFRSRRRLQSPSVPHLIACAMVGVGAGCSQKNPPKVWWADNAAFVKPPQTPEEAAAAAAAWNVKKSLIEGAS